MSELAKKLFDGLNSMKQVAVTIAPGLENVISDIRSEGVRQAKLGAMELASALFSGNSFVLYGSAHSKPEREHSPQQDQEHGHEHQRSGMER